MKGEVPDYIHASFANVTVFIHCTINISHVTHNYWQCYLCYNDNINVVICIQGYKHRKGFIIAQSPMENTVRDFVKMIYERECGVVVMLCGCEEGGVEMCSQYWPTSAGTTMKYGEFLVSTVSVDTNDGLSKRTLTITDPKVSLQTFDCQVFKAIS